MLYISCIIIYLSSILFPLFSYTCMCVWVMRNTVFDFVYLLSIPNSQKTHMHVFDLVLVYKIHIYIFSSYILYIYIIHFILIWYSNIRYQIIIVGLSYCSSDFEIFLNATHDIISTYDLLGIEMSLSRFPSINVGISYTNLMLVIVILSNYIFIYGFDYEKFHFRTELLMYNIALILYNAITQWVIKSKDNI